MPRHPGDPRSDAVGNIPFDPNEYPNRIVEPTPPPPNVGTDYIPYRGQEFHGLSPTTIPEDFSPLAGEQAAHNSAVSGQGVSAPLPTNPVPVSIVENPDLTREIVDRYQSYQVSAMVGQTIPIAPYNQLREKLILVASSSGTGAVELLISGDPSPTTINSLHVLVGAGQTATKVYESINQAAVYVTVVAGTDVVYLSAIQQNVRYQNVPLIQGQVGLTSKHGKNW